MDINLELSRKPNFMGMYLNQTTKVRVHNVLLEGIEVITKSNDNRLGFIPNHYLKTDSKRLEYGNALYVIYVGEEENYLIFAEEEIIHNNPPQDILEYNRRWKYKQTLVKEYQSKVRDHFHNLFSNPSKESLIELENILSNNDPVDVANTISQVAFTYTSDLGFINMVHSSIK